MFAGVTDYQQVNQEETTARIADVTDERNFQLRPKSNSCLHELCYFQSCLTLCLLLILLAFFKNDVFREVQSQSLVLERKLNSSVSLYLHRLENENHELRLKVDSILNLDKKWSTVQQSLQEISNKIGSENPQVLDLEQETSSLEEEWQKFRELHESKDAEQSDPKVKDLEQRVSSLEQSQMEAHKKKFRELDRSEILDNKNQKVSYGLIGHGECEGQPFVKYPGTGTKLCRQACDTNNECRAYASSDKLDDGPFNCRLYRDEPKFTTNWKKLIVQGEKTTHMIDDACFVKLEHDPSKQRCPRMNPGTDISTTLQVSRSPPKTDFECKHTKVKHFFEIAEKHLFFDPQEADHSIKGEVLDVPSWTLEFCGQSQGLYNPAFLCINPTLCNSNLPLDHAFHQISDKILAIGVARSGSGWTCGKHTLPSLSLYFVTTEYEIEAYSYFKTKFYDCRLFVTNENVHLICGSYYGPIIHRVGYDGEFHISKNAFQLRRDHRENLDRNLLPLPCGNKMLYKFWPLKIIEWYAQELEVPTRYMKEINNMTHANISHPMQVKKQGRVIKSGSKALHNSAGFLDVPHMKNRMLGIVHWNYLHGNADLVHEGGFRWGYQYMQQFFMISSSAPHQLEALGKPFCIRGNTVSREDPGKCDAVQFIMSLIDMKNGTILFTYGKNDCESAVGMITWDQVTELFDET